MFKSSASVCANVQEVRRSIYFDHHAQLLGLPINELNIDRVSPTSFQHLLLQHLHSWYTRANTIRTVTAILRCSRDGVLLLDPLMNSACFKSLEDRIFKGAIALQGKKELMQLTSAFAV